MEQVEHMNKLHSYYFNSDTTSETDSVVKKLITKYEVDDTIETNTKNILLEPEPKQESSNVITCKLCLDNNKGNYIILSCNHIFHIKCLAEEHFKDVLKYPLIDEEYFASRKCNICFHELQKEETMYLHSKFLSTTRELLDTHQTSILDLEHQMTRLKNELRTCYDYKHKLEQEREKSKQIVSILSTMI